MEELPRSARLVSWFNAWCAGEVSPDDLIDAVTGDDAAHSVAGLDRGPLGVLLAADALRRAGADIAALALPAPGDPLGVGGPRAFSEAATEAGEAAVFPGAGIGLVPSVVGSGVRWEAQPAVAATTVPDVADAERALREALVLAARESGDSPAGGAPADLVATLTSLRAARPPSLPGGYSARAGRLAALAMRCRTIVELAGVRDPWLTDVERAARRALVAAVCETPQQRTAAAR